MHSPKIELISAGRGGQPAVVRIGPHDYIAFDHDPNTILVLEETAKDFLLQDLPTGIALTPCKRIQELGDWSGDGNENWTGNGMGEWGEGSEIPITPSRFEGIAPFRIYRADHDHAGLVFSWHCTKDFWNHDAGYRWKLQQARSAVQASRKDLSGLRFHRLIDRGYWAGIEFSLFVPARSLESIMKTGYLISETLHSVIETADRKSVV